MRTGIFLNYAGGFLEAVDEVVELEKIGVGIALVPEAYSYDAISQLGFLAARTSQIELGTGVVPIYTRTPALMAMTAAGLDYVSGGRFRLGLGTSGPQVVEGFHGVPFDAPLGRTREVVEICRQVWRRERVQYSGKHYSVPLPPDQGTGLGKPLKIINHPVRDVDELGVALLGQSAQQLECPYRIDGEPFHEDSFGLPDDIATIERGVELSLGRRTDQCHRRVLSDDFSDHDRVLGEHAGLGTVEVEGSEVLVHHI